MGSRTRAKRAKSIEAVPPTDAQQLRSEYALQPITEAGQVNGKAYKKVRMLETLWRKEVIGHADFLALWNYRHNADLTDKSLVRDSLARELASGPARDGAPHFILDAQRMVAECERAAGSLSDILRAVVRDDISLSQWAIERAGAIEDCVDGICRLKPRQKALAIAKLEIQMAAKRVRAEINA